MRYRAAVLLRRSDSWTAPHLPHRRFPKRSCEAAVQKRPDFRAEPWFSLSRSDGPSSSEPVVTRFDQNYPLDDIAAMSAPFFMEIKYIDAQLIRLSHFKCQGRIPRGGVMTPPSKSGLIRPHSKAAAVQSGVLPPHSKAAAVQSDLMRPHSKATALQSDLVRRHSQKDRFFSFFQVPAPFLNPLPVRGFCVGDRTGTRTQRLPD